jgi:hypothetical protein
VLVYCEARKESARDWGHIDLVNRRSTDGGKTFSSAKPLVQMDTAKWNLKRNPAAVAQNLGREGALTLNNPLMIADRDGSVHLLYCVEYNRLFYCRSTDDGESFGEPAEITAVLDKLSSPFKNCVSRPVRWPVRPPLEKSQPRAFRDSRRGVSGQGAVSAPRCQDTKPGQVPQTPLGPAASPCRTARA